MTHPIEREVVSDFGVSEDSERFRLFCCHFEVGPKVFGTIPLRRESVSASMIRGRLGILCAIGGAVIGYSVTGVESAILGALIGFFFGKTVDSMLRVVDAT